MSTSKSSLSSASTLYRSLHTISKIFWPTLRGTTSFRSTPAQLPGLCWDLQCFSFAMNIFRFPPSFLIFGSGFRCSFLAAHCHSIALPSWGQTFLAFHLQHINFCCWRAKVAMVEAAKNHPPPYNNHPLPTRHIMLPHCPSVISTWVAGCLSECPSADWRQLTSFSSTAHWLFFCSRCILRVCVCFNFSPLYPLPFTLHPPV